MRTKLRIVVLIIIAVLLIREYVFKPSDPLALEEPIITETESAPFGESRGAVIRPGSGSGLQPTGETASCIVDRIVDGDTINCEPVGRIRLIGMDTPERGQKPFGPAATAALTAMAPIGSELLIEFDIDRVDRYDRILGYLWKDGELLNWRLVREGFALLATYPPNVRYTDHFLTAQEAAREDAAGLWAVDGFACEPSAFRRGDC